MKRWFPLFLLIIILTGCTRSAPSIHTEEADRVSIFYGLSSYALWSSDEEVVKTLSGSFNSLSFETTNRTMDLATMLSVYFFKGDTQLSEIHVDEPGTFWLNGDTICFRLSSGVFNYEKVKDLYDESKQNK